MITPHAQCCCDQCVEARRAMLLRTHPIHARREEDVAPTPIPIEQALAMRMEDREILLGMLAQVESDIRSLRDCA